MDEAPRRPRPWAVASASAVCFIRGRLTFVAGAGQSAPGNSGAPSALVAYGDDCARAIEDSGLGLTYGPAHEHPDPTADG